MTTEDHTARAEQILSEARKEAIVEATWTCSADPRVAWAELHFGTDQKELSRGLGFLGWLIPMLIGWLAAHAFMWFFS